MSLPGQPSLGRSRVRARRTAVAGTSLAVLASSTLLALGTGAAHAAPAEDCTAPFPVTDVADGDAVTGLTVSDGTVPEGFDGEVLGVLEDGIAPGVDMVMARLTSPEIDRVGGIWQGMSGSPVYAADGRLIGAVAYGLSFGPSPVAGITPFEDMDDYLGDAAAPQQVPLDARAARAVAADSEVSAREAGQGMRRLPMPVSVSGVAARRPSEVRRAARGDEARAYLRSAAVAAGRRVAGAGAGAAADAVEDDLVAGGNLAAAISYGDVDAVGVGTATSVCDGRVVGFGHPFAFSGETSLSLHPADALYVQEDPTLSPFKVAAAGAPVGTITDDRTTGITGSFGALPETTTITTTVDFEGRSRTGTTEVNLQEAVAETALYAILANHDRVIDGITGGTELQTVSITGTDADGQPFDISYADRYTDGNDITFGAVFDVADALWSISRLDGVSIDTVDIDSEVTTDESVSKVTGAQYRDSGQWVTIKRRAVRVPAGSALALRALVRSSDGTTRTERLDLAVTRKLAGQRGYGFVGGGASSYGRSGRTLAKIEESLENGPRNDQVLASLETYRRGGQASQAVSEPGDEVVRGVEGFAVRFTR